MSSLQKRDVYLEVGVVNAPPTPADNYSGDNNYFVLKGGNGDYYPDIQYFDRQSGCMHKNAPIWLQKQKMIALSEDQAKKLVEKIWEAALKSTGDTSPHPNLEEFTKQLFG